MPSDDGETAYNTESATIERYDGGFLVVNKNTASQVWHPDTMVRMAHWIKEKLPAPSP